MRYRREIDGLRALAVLSVLLFHAGVPVLRGGFVGVDVFFVISGYLITGILDEALQRGSFSLRAFYVQRARRILPALFAMMLVTMPFAWLVMLPQDLKAFAKSLVATPILASNLLFFLAGGYFDKSAELTPLLHTWSLAVEGQYYLLFPLLLLAVHRFGAHWITGILAALTALSLALAQLSLQGHPMFSFYFLPPRAFEILVGALVHRWLAGRHAARPPGRVIQEAGSFAGLALVAFAVLAFDDNTPSPGLYTLVPVLGAALIVAFANPPTMVGRLLATPALVGIGLISYSVYLWHQPLFALIRLYTLAPLGAQVGSLACIAAMVLGYASWRWIEQPFRQRKTVAGRPFTAAYVLTGLLLMGVGVAGYASNGDEARWLNQRATPDQAIAYRLLMQAKKSSPVYIPANRVDDGRCVFDAQDLAPAVVSRILQCATTHPDGVAVLGDSHSTNLFDVLYFNPSRRFNFLVGITRNGCNLHGATPGCPFAAFVRLVHDHPGVFRQVIYENAGWVMLRSRQGPVGDGIAMLAQQQRLEGISSDQRLIDGNVSDLAALSGDVDVLWVGPHDDPQVSDQARIRNGCARGVSWRPGQRELYAQLDRQLAAAVLAAGKPHLRYLSARQLYQFALPADFGDCERVLWFDTDHFSTVGERYFSRRLDPVVQFVNRVADSTASRGGNVDEKPGQ